MSELPLHKLMDHPSRSWIVGGASVLLALAVGMSTYDSVVAAKTERAGLEQKLAQGMHAVANLDEVRSRLVALEAASADNADVLDESVAKEIREKVTNFVRASDCRLVKVHLGDPQASVWVPGTNPLIQPDVSQVEDEALRLLRTELNVLAQGSLTNVDQLIEKLLSLHRLAVPTDVVVKKSGRDGTLELNVKLLLLQLQPNVQEVDE